MDLREHILDRFSALQNAPEATAPGVAGDHRLNPGMAVDGPLTPAAVLVPLIDRGDQITVMLTRRTDHLANHAGQISLPGGHMEPGESAEQTALRETEEECGLAPRHVRILGRLGDYVIRTGFRVTPVVGLVTPPFDTEPDPHEVAEIFEVPLAFLMAPENRRRESRMFKGRMSHYYVMPYGEYHIWGATAGMLVGLVEFLGQ